MKKKLFFTSIYNIYLKETARTVFYFVAFLFLLFVSKSSFSQCTLNNGLQAYYPFSGNANDMSGNNNTPTTNTATLTTDRFGNLNSAYRFNGIDNFMRIPSSTSINLGNQITLACWVRVNGFYQGNCHWNRIINKGVETSGNSNYFLGFCDDLYVPGTTCGITIVDTVHQTFHGCNNGNSWGSQNPISTYINKNIWYPIVYTNDGVTNRMYVNCVLLDTWPSITSTGNNQDLFFGRMNDINFPFWFNGDLDDVRIYNRALTQAEISQYGSCTNTLPPNDSLLSFNKCSNKTLQLNVRTGTTYSWTPSTGLSSTTIQNPTTNVNTNTTYVVTITNTTTNCTYRDTVKVIVNPLPISNIRDTSLCVGDSIQLTAPIEYTTYNWSPATNINNTNISNPSVWPSATTNYIVTITNSFGCSIKDTVLVTVNYCGCEDSCSWSKTGNTFVKPTNFIGSKNNADFKVRTNNFQRMVVTAAGNIGLNTTSPAKTLDVNGEAVVRNLPAANPNDKVVLANTIGELKSLAPGATNQYLSGNGTWQTLPTGGGGGNVTAADQGVTLLDNNTVVLGDECGKGGGAFKSKREININNQNLYFNSSRAGKIYMGNSSAKFERCKELNTRLEISSAGLEVKNDYATPNPSPSGLRFTNLTAKDDQIENKYGGVLSLDEDGDVIWVKACCNGIQIGKETTIILERLDKLEAELKAIKNENTLLKNKINQTEIVLENASSSLEQNIPNPFTETTTIGYTIATSFSKAVIIFNTANGQVLKTVQLNSAGKGQIKIAASLVARGIYTYSLFVDGKLIETKKMIKE